MVVLIDKSSSRIVLLQMKDKWKLDHDAFAEKVGTLPKNEKKKNTAREVASACTNETHEEGTSGINQLN